MGPISAGLLLAALATEVTTVDVGQVAQGWEDADSSRCLAANPPSAAPALLQVARSVSLQQLVAGTGAGHRAPSKAPEVPEGLRGMFFRPLSRTLQCVMTLTVVSLCGYTALSIARNLDELSGVFKPSIATQALTVAARGCSAMPMLAMLCVTCRMYVLSVTAGLGEPPASAKLCMFLATSGLLLQLLAVLALPGFTTAYHEQGEAWYDMPGAAGTLLQDSSARELSALRPRAGPAKGQTDYSFKEAGAHDGSEIAAVQQATRQASYHDFATATGDRADMHPDLRRVRYRRSARSLAPVFWVTQIVSMLLLYGGMTGVLANIVSFEGPDGGQADPDGIPASILCTMFLSVVYFLVYVALWVARSIPEGDTQAVLVQATLSMSSSVRKAPMFCVLFLASRMRALQLDPPHGKPPDWMQACFLCLTVCLYLEALFAMMAGATCTLGKAYYGVYMFRAPKGSTIGKLVKVCQHLCALATYVAMVPILAGEGLMVDADGHEVPLSVTMYCVLVFQVAYFTVMFGQTAVMFWEDLHACELPMLCDTLVAASISLSLAPMLCVLFVAVRMRALQITQQRGSPPGWTQDCMVVSAFATCVQALCCLVMPIFIGKACRTDEDGNPDYDLRPMVGAYAVTVVKYVALISLHGAVMLICWSVVTMTPETATGSSSGTGMSIVDSCSAFAVVFFLALLFSSAKVVGMAIKLAIESCDRSLLGVDITIRRAALSVFRGYVNVSGLIVHQPDEEMRLKRDAAGVRWEPTGRKLVWKEDYMARIGTLLVKIDMWRLVRSCGKVFDIDHIIFKGIRFNVEKPDIQVGSANSNLDYIIKFLNPPSDGGLEDTGEGDARPQSGAGAQDEPRGKRASWARVILRRVEVGDIAANVLIKNVPVVGEITFRPKVGVVAFDDLQSEVFGGRDCSEGLGASEVVLGVVGAIASRVGRTVLLAVPRQVAQATRGLLQASGTKASQAASRCAECTCGGGTRSAAASSGDRGGCASCGSGLLRGRGR